jgi:hypothetical protein
MTASQQPRQRHGAGDGAGRGQERRSSSNGGGSHKSGSTLAGRTTVRTLVALGTYVAQDVRDPDGLTRPALRRAALRLAASRQQTLRRLGGAYLRKDPPTARELAAGEAGESVPPVPPAAPGGNTGEADVIDIDPDDVTEVV